jgi:hypothetical protein
VAEADSGRRGHVKYKCGRSGHFQVAKGIPVPIVYTCPVSVAKHDARIVSGSLVFGNKVVNIGRVSV